MRKPAQLATISISVSKSKRLVPASRRGTLSWWRRFLTWRPKFRLLEARPGNRNGPPKKRGKPNENDKTRATSLPKYPPRPGGGGSFSGQTFRGQISPWENTRGALSPQRHDRR